MNCARRPRHRFVSQTVDTRQADGETAPVNRVGPLWSVRPRRKSPRAEAVRGGGENVDVSRGKRQIGIGTAIGSALIGANASPMRPIQMEGTDRPLFYHQAAS